MSLHRTLGSRPRFKPAALPGWKMVGLGSWGSRPRLKPVAPSGLGRSRPDRRPLRLIRYDSFNTSLISVSFAEGWMGDPHARLHQPFLAGQGPGGGARRRVAGARIPGTTLWSRSTGRIGRWAVTSRTIGRLNLPSGVVQSALLKPSASPADYGLALQGF